MPGWRLGFAHGPSAIIREMIKLQQYSFVCAPQPSQWAGAAALDVDMSRTSTPIAASATCWSRASRDDYELAAPGGAFYALSRGCPGAAAWSSSPAAIEKHQLLVIPGNVFSRRDTHFRISYAASDAMIARGIEALQSLARER